MLFDGEELKLCKTKGKVSDLLKASQQSQQTDYRNKHTVGLHMVQTM
jgi:hypothetical protein